MTSSDTPTVMGPSGGLSASSSTAGVSSATINGSAIPLPPTFKDSKTNKHHYRVQLRQWMKAINKLASGDNSNAQSFRKIVGFRILNHCDQVTQETIDATNTSGKINLDSSENEQEFANLVEGVIKVNAERMLGKFRRPVF